MRLTEREVDNDVVCSKLGRDIARRAREEGSRRALCIRHGSHWVSLICTRSIAAPETPTQLSVLIVVAPFRISLGMLPALRDQNQTLMNEFVRSIA